MTFLIQSGNPRAAKQAARKSLCDRLWPKLPFFSLRCSLGPLSPHTYFGSLLPHSIAAKSLAYRLPATAATIRLLQHYATPFLEQNIFGVPWIVVGLILYPFLYLIGFQAIYRKDRRSLAFLVYPWFYFLTFAIANPLIFRWYLTPPLPIYMLVILVGAVKILGDLLSPERSSSGNQTSRSRFIYSFSVLALILLPFASSLSEWRLTPDHGLTRPAPEMAWYRLELLYAQAAEYLQPYLDENTIIAAGDVGVLGFRTNAPILDTVGLNSRQAVDYYPLNPEYYSINYAVPPELILNEKPEFIVLLEAYIRNGLLKSDEFYSSYQLIKKIPTDIYGSNGMLIFSRIPGK